MAIGSQIQISGRGKLGKMNKYDSKTMDKENRKKKMEQQTHLSFLIKMVFRSLHFPCYFSFCVLSLFHFLSAIIGKVRHIQRESEISFYKLHLFHCCWCSCSFRKIKSFVRWRFCSVSSKWPCTEIMDLVSINLDSFNKFVCVLH